MNLRADGGTIKFQSQQITRLTAEGSLLPLNASICCEDQPPTELGNDLFIGTDYGVGADLAQQKPNSLPERDFPLNPVEKGSEISKEIWQGILNGTIAF